MEGEYGSIAFNQKTRIGMSNLSTLAMMQMRAKKPDPVIPWDDKTMCSFCGMEGLIGKYGSITF